MLRLFDFLNVHTLLVACLLLPTSMAFLGCEAEDGPAENVGEELDEANEEAHDAAD